MARPKTDQFWVQRIYEAKANEPQITSKQIEARLQAEGERAGKRGWPTERTIRNLLQGFGLLPKARRFSYGYFRWPQSMGIPEGSPELPWEASEVCLELLRRYQRTRRTYRPRIGLTKWFWRVTRSSPGASFDFRYMMAGQLDFAERYGDLDLTGESVERVLVTQEEVPVATANVMFRDKAFMDYLDEKFGPIEGRQELEEFFASDEWFRKKGSEEDSDAQAR